MKHLFVALPLMSTALLAQADAFDDCMQKAVLSATENTTVGELRTYCEERAEADNSSMVDIQVRAATEAGHAETIIEQRRALEMFSRDNPFVLTPYRPNFIMPLRYVKNPNEAPHTDLISDEISLDHEETEFQFSVKLVLWDEIIGDNGHLSMAYTNRSFWQALNSPASAPFRDTNHEPELILSFDNDWEFMGFRNSQNEIIFNHHSNGRSGEQSRSWNRVMLRSLFERDNFVASLTAWHRIEEDPEEYPGDPKGDDNPDIEKYMGNFELLTGYKYKHNRFSLKLRNNLRSDNRGAAEFAWSFRIDGRTRGYLKYFNGYGESIIDYDAHVESLSLGISLTDWF